MNYNTKYDSLFLNYIKERGINYYKLNKIKEYDVNNNIITSVVKGTDDYKVIISFNSKNDLYAVCSCPYNQENNILCKHIYAVLLKYCIENNEIENDNIDSFALYKEFIDIVLDIDEIINNTLEYYDMLDDISDKDYLFDEILSYKDYIDVCKNISKDSLDEKQLEKVKDIYNEVLGLYEELNDEEIDENKEKELYKIKENINNNINDDKKKRKKLKSDWGLLDYEVDEVLNGDYEPYQFSTSDEEELEEDDFYYE